MSQYLHHIRAVILDVDGVLTDGTITIGPSGVYKTFNIKDGAGIAHLRDAGIPVCFLTGRSDEATWMRFDDLKLNKNHYIEGCKDKHKGFLHLSKILDIPPEHIAYMGDDVADIPALQLAGYSTCPNDAVLEVKEASHKTYSSNGGYGAVRELCDEILFAVKQKNSFLPQNNSD